jgi:hypothetical protein
MAISERLLRILNGREGSFAPNDDAERRIHTARRVGGMAMTGELAKYQDQLESLHASIERLGTVAAHGSLASEIEIIRPLRQDRLHNTVLGSKKYSRLNTGHGFTMAEYIHGEKIIGVSERRFHVVRGPDEELTGVAIPFTMDGEPNITKRLRVRPNTRPEDLAIALDGSGRSWAGIYIPHGTATEGAKLLPTVLTETMKAAVGKYRKDRHKPALSDEKVVAILSNAEYLPAELRAIMTDKLKYTAEHEPAVPVFGVWEDPKTQPWGDHALENYQAVVPGTTSTVRIVDKTYWLREVQTQIESMYTTASLLS